MTTHVSGQAAAGTAAPALHVAPQRRVLLSIIIGCPLFTDAEQVRANHNAHECADASRLATWTRNLLAERDRREAANLARAEAGATARTPADVARFETGMARFEAKLAQPQPTTDPTCEGQDGWRDGSTLLAA